MYLCSNVFCKLCITFFGVGEELCFSRNNCRTELNSRLTCCWQEFISCLTNDNQHRLSSLRSRRYQQLIKASYVCGQTASLHPQYQKSPLVKKIVVNWNFHRKNMKSAVVFLALVASLFSSALGQVTHIFFKKYKMHSLKKALLISPQGNVQVDRSDCTWRGGDYGDDTSCNNGEVKN